MQIATWLPWENRVIVNGDSRRQSQLHDVSACVLARDARKEAEAETAGCKHRRSPCEHLRSARRKSSMGNPNASTSTSECASSTRKRGVGVGTTSEHVAARPFMWPAFYQNSIGLFILGSFGMWLIALHDAAAYMYSRNVAI